ncbi:5'-nucleotidase [Hymenobacter koreensis]|uniref:5'-Nucleotidase C-terminal domain-containing protein n=1 Tax=Hymenobacter koreensis TaxID=1084523 RepID=A0ABP8IVF6_9BACT
MLFPSFRSASLRRLALGLVVGASSLSACQRAGYQPTLGTTVAETVGGTQPIDPQAEAVIVPYRERVQQQMSEVIGTAPVALRKNQGESPLANFVADVVRVRAGEVLGQPVDLGIMPNGSLRSELPAGNITVGSVFELMPFENEVVVLDLSGPLVQQMFDYAAAIKMAFSGATYTSVNGKATDILIGGKPLDPARTYTIAISDYHAGGGDRLDFLKPLTPRKTGVLVRTAVNDHIRALTKAGKTVEAKVEGRVKS